MSTNVVSDEEKVCPRCAEAWPLTAEFFRRLMGRRWQSYCRACEAEWVAEKRAAAAAAGRGMS